MKPLDRDISILRHTVTCCQQIEQTIERFGDSAEIPWEIITADIPALKKFCLTVIEGQE